MSHEHHDKNATSEHTDKVEHDKKNQSTPDNQADVKSCNSTDSEEDCNASNADTATAEETSESKIVHLEQKVAELKDLYVRAQAEMQNKDRRSHEDVKKARDYAISKFATDLVAVKDYLEMALKDQSGNFEMLKMGVDLTLKQLVQVFESHKVKTIEPNIGDKLDPHLHQAVDTVEAEGKDTHTIITVMQKGYSLNERVLRPAMVAVAK